MRVKLFRNVSFSLHAFEKKTFREHRIFQLRVHEYVSTLKPKTVPKIGNLYEIIKIGKFIPVNKKKNDGDDLTNY